MRFYCLMFTQVLNRGTKWPAVAYMIHSNQLSVVSPVQSIFINIVVHVSIVSCQSSLILSLQSSITLIGCYARARIDSRLRKR